MERFKVNDKKQTEQEMYKHKAQKLTSRKPHGFPRGKKGSNNIATVPNKLEATVWFLPEIKKKGVLYVWTSLCISSAWYDTQLPAQGGLGFPITKQLMFSAFAASFKPGSKCTRYSGASGTGFSSTQA